MFASIGRAKGQLLSILLVVRLSVVRLVVGPVESGLIMTLSRRRFC